MQLLSRARLFATEREICNSEEAESVIWGDLEGG